MTEANFVDYVKLIVRSGNGGKGSMHLRREKFISKGVPMEAMEEGEAILLSELIEIYGPSILSSLNVILMRDMELTVVKVGVQVLRVRTYL